MPSYPLTFPADVISPKSDRLRPIFPSATFQAQYTGHSYSSSFLGQWWERTMSFAPMLRYQARELVAFLLSLQGREGTFTCPIFEEEPQRGNPSGAVVVDYISADGLSIGITGAPANVADFLLKGDYFQVNNTLIQVMFNDVDTDSSGNAEFEVFPRLSSGNFSRGIDAGAPLVFTEPAGIWRLKSDFEMDVDEVMFYGITDLVLTDAGI